MMQERQQQQTELKQLFQMKTEQVKQERSTEEKFYQKVKKEGSAEEKAARRQANLVAMNKKALPVVLEISS